MGPERAKPEILEAPWPGTGAQLHLGGAHGPGMEGVRPSGQAYSCRLAPAVPGVLKTCSVASWPFVETKGKQTQPVN